MEKKSINLSSIMYYINLVVLICNLVYFSINITILKKLHGYFIVPIITLVGFIVSIYMKKKLKLSGIELYVLRVVLFLNIIISLLFLLIFSLLIYGLARNITH
ncbi:hypothetical protein [Paramaledivibacter caminithermalis]|jgi:hypothetical protein|uniref:Uncharacterized protein n=1 Tax=Paramaledivibacter caminithermalis (strain DSM 15212 / CIP 107654 / DViRD3) TaxID=1121301 RepID=A0A1M6SNF7_PARC5|nr:hypothetical protein [Paramaledivibacter caminithermalis]SHK46176.1 hypothetical protein SAMN02745912_03373 [Paramaledivibacter caminithermalis DSM 15212]